MPAPIITVASESEAVALRNALEKARKDAKQLSWAGAVMIALGMAWAVLVGLRLPGVPGSGVLPGLLVVAGVVIWWRQQAVSVWWEPLNAKIPIGPWFPEVKAQDVRNPVEDNP